MILVINKDKKLATGVSDMLYFMGILSYPATPEEALPEFSENYSAALILSPAEIYDEEEFLMMLRALSPRVPVFCHGRTASPLYYDKSFSASVSAAHILNEVKRYTGDMGYKVPGEYFGGKDCYKNELYEEFTALFTRSEKMILKLLSHLDKEPLRADTILKYSFRASRLPDLASIRTHISIINKKTMKFCGRKIISSNEKGAYKADFSFLELKAKSV